MIKLINNTLTEVEDEIEVTVEEPIIPSVEDRVSALENALIEMIIGGDDIV